MCCWRAGRRAGGRAAPASSACRSSAARCRRWRRFPVSYSSIPSTTGQSVTMVTDGRAADQAIQDLEILDWVESLEDVLALRGPPRVRRLLDELEIHAQQAGVTLPTAAQTPYVNTIPADQ